MPIIKNISKRDRMVADRILKPGDAKYITPRQALQFVGIPDFEIVDETPLQTKPVVAPEPKVLSSLKAGREDPAPTLPAKARKPRGKKK